MVCTIKKSAFAGDVDLYTMDNGVVQVEASVQPNHTSTLLFDFREDLITGPHFRSSPTVA